jgi:hypothetical protein
MISMERFYTVRVAIIACLVCLVLGTGTGVRIGWRIWKPHARTQETKEEGYIQKDSSIVLPKQPDVNAKPKQIIPKGSVVERIVYVEVQPKKPAGQLGEDQDQTNGQSQEDKGSQADGSPCPPVRVDLTLVRMPDGKHRVVVSSQNGEILGGMDTPVEEAKPVKELKWAFGLRYALSSDGSKSIGPTMDYDKGALRSGADVNYVKHQSINQAEWTIGGRLLIRF